MWLNNLTSLEQVSFWGNQIGGPIPNLSGLTNLELLKLQSNNLTGGVPAWFGEMSSLRILYLQLNSLSGPIPPELGKSHGAASTVARPEPADGHHPAGAGQYVQPRER